MNKSYITVRDKESARLLLDHIKSFDILAFDTETNSLNPRKGKVIGFSISGEEGKGFYFPTMIWNAEKESLEDTFIDDKPASSFIQFYLKLLLDKKLVMHNASFDIRFTKNYYGIDLLPALYADTALLVHTVKEEGAFGYGMPFALKSIAIMMQKELGLDMEKRANEEQLALKESIKRNGGTITKDHFEIYKADLEILSEYAAADTDLTLRIYKLFLKQLQVEGLEKFFFEDEVMPLYKEVTIPMEEKGIMLDMELIKETRTKIEEDLQHYKKLVVEELLAQDKVRKWIIDCSVKEYPPSNKGTFAQELARQNNLPLPVSDKTGKYTMNKASVNTLEDGPIKKFLLTGDTSHLTANQIAKVSMKLWREDNDGNFFNIQSKDQMGQIAFKVLKIKPLSETSKGKAQFDDDLIQAISEKYHWAENLRIYNKLLKIKSTYVDRFYDSAEDSRFYPYFKQNGTVSGRYGSDLQQLPRPKEDGEAAEIIIKYTNQIRAFFISDPGYIFIDCDYESLEPHLFASISDDKNLQEIFNTGYDFYSYVAIKTEKLEGVSADKKAPNFLKKVDNLKRNKAKAYSLGIAYGMSPYALAMSLNVQQKEGEKLHAAYLEGFPGVANWIEKSREFVKANGYIKNEVGRIRHLPVVKEVYSEMGDNLMNWRVRKDLEPEYGREAVTSLYRDYRNGLNNTLNFQIQSYAASVVNRAALAINREFKKRGWDGQVVAQIHDQLVVLVKEDIAKEAAPVVKHLMETTTQPQGITLKAPPELAHNLRDGH